jgi:hypothetical protein
MSEFDQAIFRTRMTAIYEDALRTRKHRVAAAALSLGSTANASGAIEDHEQRHGLARKLPRALPRVARGTAGLFSRARR